MKPSTSDIFRKSTLRVGILSLTISPLLAFSSLSAQEPTAQDLNSGDSAAKVAQNEQVRRTQSIFAANKAVEDGAVFLQAGDYPKADEQFQFVLKNVAPDGPTQALYNRASTGEAQVKLAQAVEARKNGDFDHASSLLAEAVQYDPAVKPQADAEADRVRQDRIRDEKQRTNPESVVNNPVITPEFKDQVATVQRDLFEGDRYFETGQYDRAEASYKLVLVIDPYNQAARQKLERLDRYKMRAAVDAHDTTRTEALYDIERRWSEKEVAAPQQGPAATEPAQESNIARLTNKLNSIRIDSVSFVGTPVDDAIRILAGKAKEADSTGEGINFVLKLRPNVIPVAPKTGNAPAGTGKTSPAVATAVSATPPPVTLSLNDVSLAEVLRVLTQLTNLKYKVEEYAVYILPATETSDVLIPRTFVVPTGFFQGGLTASASTPAAGVNSLSAAGSVSSVQIDVKQQLIDQGVDFPPGSTAAFISGSSRLVVKNTPDEMDRIDALLQAASKEEDPQVEIETKFTEFTDNQLRELVNNWSISFGATSPGPLPTSAANSPLGEQTFIQQQPGAVGPIYAGQTALRGQGDITGDSLDGLLSNSGLNGSTAADSVANFYLGAVIGGTGMALISTLIDEIHGVDLLSAPKVTTKNRAAAKVEISEQMSYPSQFTAPTYNSNLVQYGSTTIDIFGDQLGNQVTLIAPPTPSSFNKQAIGVTLDVTPVAYADRRIDLDLKPEVTDFEGFIDYGSTINQGNLFGDPVISPVEVYHVRQPVFNNRKITTKLQVIDGQTVIMGGLVREDTQVINDKVPVLGDIPVVGRLFQSKVNQKTKRNLIIFITARIIRSTGKPKYTPLDTVTTTPEVTAENTTHIGS